MGQGKEAFGRKDFPTTWISSVHGSLARELPAVVADTAKAEGVALGRSATRRRNHPCGTKNFLWVSCNTPAPVRVEGNSLSLAPAARASSLEREPFSRIARVAREDKKTAAEKKFSYYMSLMVHGSLARELPKAEGVAFRRSAT